MVAGELRHLLIWYLLKICSLQLVYCSSCCEPFHPYCSDDDALLTAYLAEVSLRPTITGGLVHKFRKWKCSQCLTCSHCGCGRRDGEDDFIGMKTYSKNSYS